MSRPDDDLADAARLIAIAFLLGLGLWLLIGPR